MTIRFLDSNIGPSLLWYTYDKGKSWKGPFHFPQFGDGVAARTDYLDQRETRRDGISHRREG